jgi:hypothetical protein
MKGNISIIIIKRIFIFIIVTEIKRIIFFNIGINSVTLNLNRPWRIVVVVIFSFSRSINRVQSPLPATLVVHINAAIVHAPKRQLLRLCPRRAHASNVSVGHAIAIVFIALNDNPHDFSRTNNADRCR